MAFDQPPNLRPVHCYWFVFGPSIFFIQEIIFPPSFFSSKASNTEVLSFLLLKLYHRETTKIHLYGAYILVVDPEYKHMN